MRHSQLRRYGVVPLVLAMLVVCVVSPEVSRAGAFDQALASAMPRVVKLYGRRVGKQAGYGTGFLVSNQGHVVTVSSVLIDARRIRAVTADGTLYEADVVARDRRRQLALLKLNPAAANNETNESSDTEPIEHLPFFDLTIDAPLEPGDWMLAAGNAFKVADGAEPATVAHGIFSARTRLDARRRLKDFPYQGEVLVIDAITSNPGAPGSAVVNLDGAFVGMIGRVVVSNLTHTHFNYAMPREEVAAFVDAALAAPGGGPGGDRYGADSLAMDADVEPFDTGIRLSKIGYQKLLPFVERVRIASPARNAGVRKDDLIMAVNGRNVGDVSQFDNQMRRAIPGKPIELVIRRGHGILTISIPTEPL